MKQKTDSREASRKSFDRQAATYDEDRNGAHARKMYARVLEKIGDFGAKAPRKPMIISE